MDKKDNPVVHDGKTLQFESDEDAMFDEAARLFGTKQFEKSAQAYEVLVTKFPKRAAYSGMQAGLAWSALGEHEKAIKAFVAAREEGADAGAIDDHLWNAVQAIAQSAPNADEKAKQLLRYEKLCPKGRHLNTMREMV